MPVEAAMADDLDDLDALLDAPYKKVSDKFMAKYYQALISVQNT